MVGSEQGQGEWRSICGFVWTREFVQNWKSPRKNQRIESCEKVAEQYQWAARPGGLGAVYSYLLNLLDISCCSCSGWSEKISKASHENIPRVNRIQGCFDTNACAVDAVSVHLTKKTGDAKMNTIEC